MFLHLSAGTNAWFLPFIWREPPRTVEAGTGFAFPSCTLYFARDTGLHDAKSAEPAKKMDEWRKNNGLPFPDFHPDDIPNLPGQIVEPVPESSVHKTKE